MYLCVQLAELFGEGGHDALRVLQAHCPGADLFDDALLIRSARVALLHQGDEGPKYLQPRSQRPLFPR